MPKKERLKLHGELTSILGSTDVYFQPPETIKMNYPCIVYQKSKGKVLFASNNRYADFQAYTVTVIDKNPDSEIPDKVKNFFYNRLDRHFVADKLHHTVYTIYYK